MSAFLCRTIAALSMAAALLGAQHAGAEQTPTRVTTFVPVIPSGAARPGTCWTRSIAAPARGDAWRCMVGNEISDPCFTVRGRAGIAVCDANPASGGRGFVLRLTKPLPNEATYKGDAGPWLVELAGGDVCVRLTGTHSALGSESIGYECSESRALRSAAAYTGLIDGGFTAGTVWHARKAVYRIGRSGAISATVSRVPLAAVWR